jgi:hypothetical protein
MRGVKTDLTGRDFGKLSVLGPTEKRDHGYVVWDVQCACGSPSFPCSTVALTSRKSPKRSCGCLSTRKSAGESARNRVQHDYRNNAKKRGVSWDLTDEQFNQLTQADCHYCGRPPASVCSGRGYNGSYTYNGIDRKDNTIGYVEWNVVSCCRVCNWAKGKMSYADFALWVADLVCYQSQKQTSNLLVRGQSA